MRFIWVLIILQAANAANNDTATKEYLDLSVAEDNAFLWKNLFIKLNTVLSETEKLGQGLGDVNKRLDDLSNRQADHENRLTKLMENVYESRVESLKMQQDQENRHSKLMENVNEIREDAKKRQEERQTQLVANVNASRVDANIRQDLTKLMANIDGIRGELNKRLDTQGELLRNSFNRSLKWTTILRRQDGSVDFNRNWNDYSNGFGNPNGDFFMGLQKLHDITTYDPPQELMIILKDFDGQTRYAKYDHFRIGSEAEKYALLELGAYSGDAGNDLAEHRGHKFTTYDQDNDNNDSRNCAETFSGGWWFFGLCYSGYLNGPYRQENQSNTWGISWNSFRRWNHSLKYAEMMIRAKL